MQKLAIECRAKINLAIDVIGKRENGYHDVEMIMQEIGLADKLELKLRKDGKITISTDVSFIPVNEENLAYRAAKVFFERLGRDEGVDIHIEKKIPMGAGLGGVGSFMAVRKHLNV